MRSFTRSNPARWIAALASIAATVGLSLSLKPSNAAPPSPLDGGLRESKSVPSPSSYAPDGRTEGDKGKLRQREGTKLADRRGRFEQRGERYVFLTDDKATHYVVLENLMLERVSTVLAEAAGGQLQWSVHGTVTEFRGANYLIVERAVVKSSADNDEPRRLADPLANTRNLPAPAP